jgi:hypothetical protein
MKQYKKFKFNFSYNFIIILEYIDFLIHYPVNFIDIIYRIILTDSNIFY